MLTISGGDINEQSKTRLRGPGTVRTGGSLSGDADLSISGDYSGRRGIYLCEHALRWLRQVY